MLVDFLVFGMSSQTPIKSSEKAGLINTMCRAWFGGTETMAIKVCDGQAKMKFEHNTDEEFVFELHVTEPSSFNVDLWSNSLQDCETTPLEYLTETICSVLKDNFNYELQFDFIKDPSALKSYPVYREKIKSRELSVDSEVPA